MVGVDIPVKQPTYDSGWFCGVSIGVFVGHDSDPHLFVVEDVFVAVGLLAEKTLSLLRAEVPLGQNSACQTHRLRIGLLGANGGHDQTRHVVPVLTPLAHAF